MSWLVFGGVVFLLMGLGLAADARGHARSAAQWLPEEQARSLAAAYRLGGGFFLAFGLFLLAGAAAFPAWLGGWLKPHPLDRRGRVAAGLFLIACGAGVALAKRSEGGGGPGLSARVEAELGLSSEPEALGPRLSRWAGWALAGAFFSFGVWLLTGSDAA